MYYLLLTTCLLLLIIYYLLLTTYRLLLTKPLGAAPVHPAVWALGSVTFQCRSIWDWYGLDRISTVEAGLVRLVRKHIYYVWNRVWYGLLNR